jgi:UBX domain
LLTVVSSNGQLKEYLTAGISKADFLQRVKVALNDGSEISTPVTTEGISTPVSVHESDQPVASTSSLDQAPAEEEQSRAVRQLLAERSARLESKKKEQDAAEKAERAAKAKARKEALETAAANPEDSKKAADMKYALMQKKRQQDARDERARILKRVEDDKAERRAKEALRKELVKAAMEPSDLQSSTPAQTISSNLRRSLKDQGSDCALQVRLFDGSTIRSRFSPHNTLRKDVRQWIDSQRADGDIPYTFKQVLTPHPNRTITISEEEESLQSVGLNPSATLILVPVKDYTSAYEGGPTSYISRGISAGVGLVSSSISMVTGTLGSLLGGSATPQVEVEPENRSSSQASAAANVRTFREQGGSPEEHQFYNGNTVSIRVHLQA